MSLENNIKRIADNSEIIAAQLAELVKTVQQTINPVINVTSPAATASEVINAALDSIAPAAPVAAPAPVQTESAAEATPPAGAVAAINNTAPAPTLLNDTDMNNALVAEFSRIGSREPIDAVMNAMGITGVTGLIAEKQQELLTAVRAVQS